MRHKILSRAHLAQTQVLVLMNLNRAITTLRLLHLQKKTATLFYCFGVITCIPDCALSLIYGIVSRRVEIRLTGLS
jgi:hypothetical protein